MRDDQADTIIELLNKIAITQSFMMNELRETNIHLDTISTELVDIESNII